jgi:hypothetical protein
MLLAMQNDERDLLVTLMMYLTHERGTAFVQYMTENAQSRTNQNERAMLMQLSALLLEQIPKHREEALIRLHGPSGTEVIKGPVG